MREKSFLKKKVKSSITLLIMLLFGIIIATAQTRNPTPDSYNPYGTYTNGLLEYLRMGTGLRNEVLVNTPMYDGRGLEIGTARAGILGDVNDSSLGGYNAAAMIDINISGVKKKAVLCWNIVTTNPYGRKTGYVLTEDLKYQSTIESRMATCKTKLDSVRPDDSGKSSAYYLIKNQVSPYPDTTYVYPNQTGAANKVKYYYVNNGTLNLLVDLPYTLGVGGVIKGKAIDLASPGRSFRRLPSISSEYRDIYEKGSSTIIGQVKFVYGYVYTDYNDRIYCWVNYDCLELPTLSSVISAEEDAYVRGGSSNQNTNYGTDPILAVKENSNSDYDRMSFLKFDLSNITNSVSQAIIRLKVNSNSSGAEHTLHLVSDDSWTETGITWNNKPTAGSFVSEDLVPATDEWIEFDVTSILNTELSSDGTLSVRISESSNTYATYHSMDAVNASDRPQLTYNLTSSKKGTQKIVSEVDNELDTTIKVYPNPASNGEVFIKTNASTVQSIHMFDVLGRKLDVTYNKTANGVQVFSDYTGIAFIQVVHSDNIQTTHKVIWK